MELSTPGGGRDEILDFDAGTAGAKGNQDLIDLSAIDARGKTGKDDAFTFIGNNAFSGHAGELHWLAAGSDEGGLAMALIEGDTNGDGLADFQLLVHYIGTLGASDFIL